VPVFLKQYVKHLTRGRRRGTGCEARRRMGGRDAHDQNKQPGGCQDCRAGTILDRESTPGLQQWIGLSSGHSGRRIRFANRPAPSLRHGCARCRQGTDQGVGCPGQDFTVGDGQFDPASTTGAGNQVGLQSGPFQLGQHARSQEMDRFPMAPACKHAHDAVSPFHSNRFIFLNFTRA
jgi:hypothetical protein